jgi:hypothetical protein
MDLGSRDLYQEMRQDKIVIAYLEDVEIAKQFYQSLCNVDWYLIRPPIPQDEQIIQKLKGETDDYWSCSWRTAGGYIADIRNSNYNTNEDYMSFYCSGNEGIVPGLVEECFNRMGWVPKGHLNER